MEKRIKSLYTTDNIIVLVSILIIWCNVGFVLSQVLDISPSQLFSSVAIGSGVAALAALTATSVALILHLKKQNLHVYGRARKPGQIIIRRRERHPHENVQNYFRYHVYHDPLLCHPAGDYVDAGWTAGRW